MSAADGSAPQQPRGVAMVTNRYHPLFGGAAVQARRLSASLRDRGWRPFIITARTGDLSFRDRVDDIPVWRTPTFGARSWRWFTVFFWAGCCGALLLRLRSWSILHIHGVSHFSWFPLSLARLFRRKVIVKMTLMGADDAGALEGGVRGWMQRQVFSRADAVISISTPMSEAYRAAGLEASKLVEMPQGVDIERYRPSSPQERRALRERLGLASEGPLLVCVGAIFHRKGSDIAIEAFERLAPTRPDLRLVMVGMDDTTWDPVEMPEELEFSRGLKRGLAEAGLAERVVFSGVVDNVEDYMRAADLFLFPSRREGFGTVMVEAMAAGLPCLVSPIDGIAATVFRSADDGVIVPDEDPDRWATEIARLLDEPERAARMAAAARAIAESRYSFRVVADRYEALYAAVLEGRSGMESVATAEPPSRA